MFLAVSTSEGQSVDEVIKQDLHVFSSIYFRRSVC